jgi:hypothetical protein
VTANRKENTMRLLPIFLIALPLCLSAHAQTAGQAAPPKTPTARTTLEWVTTNSVVMSVAGHDLPVTYTQDGKLSANNGAVTGTWRIDGETLCSTVTSMPNPKESCILYPPNQKPGDTFELETPQGLVNITINKSKAG